MDTLEERCADGFGELLTDSHFAQAEANEHACYGVWADGKLAYFNPGWFRFAAENDALAAVEQWGLGRSVFDAFAPSVRELYETAYAKVFADGRPWGHEYECSSEQVYRRFHMHVYALGERRGLLTTNALVVAHEHDPREREDHPPIAERYRGPDGLILQCAFCRRTRRAGEDAQWDWVSHWVPEAPPGVSGGVCPNCHSAYFE